DLRPAAPARVGPPGRAGHTRFVRRRARVTRTVPDPRMWFPMCGIAGEIAATGRAPDVSAVVRMAERLRARGPDGAGSWSQGRAAFAHRRLKIIDLSEHAAQPMTDSELGLT